jgi:hypothetical protein
MNHIYKVIWSKTKHCYVVVSELAHRNGKVPIHSVRKVAVLAAFVLTMGTSMVLTPQIADASYSAGGGTISDGSASIAIGSNTSGSTTIAKNQSIAIGDNAKATGDASDSKKPDGTALDNTKGSAVAVGLKANASGIFAIAIGKGALATNWGAVSLGDAPTASGYDSTAIGSVAQATGTRSTAIGTYARATALNSTAIGKDSVAGAERSIVIGVSATASNSATSSIAIGDSASLTASNSLALGSGAKATNSRGVALGAGSVTTTPHTDVSTKYFELATGTKLNYAGQPSSANSVVSIGDNGSERQIQNVSAGQVSATSTDAINGSQIYQIATGLETEGIKVAGDAGSSTTQLNKLITIKGDGTNISTSDAADTDNGSTVTISMSSTPTFTSATIGGVSIKGGQIKNLTAGSDGTDAVNVNQLNAAVAGVSMTVAAGNHVKNVVKTNDTSGHPIYTVNVDDMTVKSGIVAYDNNGAGTMTLTNGDGTSSTVTGLKNTYTTAGTINGSTATFTRNDGGTYSVNLGGLKSSVKAGDNTTVTSTTNTDGSVVYTVSAAAGATDTDTHVKAGNYAVSGNKVSMPLVDKTDTATGDNVTITGVASTSDVAAATTEVKGGKNVASVTKTTDTTDNHPVYTVNVNDMTAKSGTVTYGTNGTGTATITNGDGSTATISGLKNTYTTAGSLSGTTETFTRNDGTTYDVDLSSMKNDIVASDQHVKKGSYAVSGNNVTIPIVKGTNDTATSDNVVLTGIASTGDITTINNNISSLVTDGIKVAGDTGNSTTQLGKKITIKGDSKNITTADAADSDNGSTVTVSMSDTPTFTSATIGGVSVAGGKISNLTAGTADTDAVNVSQLNSKTAAATTEVKAGTNVTSVVKTADTTDNHPIYTVNVKDMGVKSGTVSYDTTGAGTATLTNGDNTTSTITGLKNTYTTTSTLSGTKATFTRNDGETYDLDLSNLKTALGTADYRLVGSGTDQKGAYTVDSNNKVKLNVYDPSSSTTNTVEIDGVASTDDITNVNNTINNLKTDGIKVAGDTGSSTTQLGKKITIKGDSKNITTVDAADSDNGSTITVKMSDTPTFTSATIGGVSVAGGKISNLTAGTADTDAVNVSQLNSKTAAATTEVKAGDNVSSVAKTTDATDGHAIYTVNVNDMTAKSGTVTYGTDGTGTGTLTNGDGSTTTISGLKNTYTTTSTLNGTKATFTRNDGETYDLDLSNLKTALGTADYRLVGSGTDQKGAYTVDSNNKVKLNVYDPSSSTTNTVEIDGVASTDDITNVNNTINNLKTDGIKVAGDTGSSTTQLGKKVSIVGDGKNITTVDAADSDNGSTVTVSMSDTPTFTSATIGGVSVAGGKISNLTAGTADTDAVNVSQLTKAKDDVTASDLHVKKGSYAVTSNSVTMPIVKGTTDTATTDNVVLTGVASTDDITNVNNTINNLKTDGIKVAGDTGSSTTQLGKKVSIVGDGKNITTVDAADSDNGSTVTVSMSDTPTFTSATIGGVDIASGKISNLTAGTADTDAVNVSQLNSKTAAATTEVKAGDNVSSVAKTTDATDGHAIYTVNVNDMTAKSGTVTYGTDGTGTGTLTNGDGSTTTISGLKNTYTTTSTLNGTKATFTRNDGETYDLDLSNLKTALGTADYRLVGSGTDQKGAYTVSDDNKVNLNVYDPSSDTTNTVEIDNIAKATDVGPIADIKPDGTGDTSGNTVVNNINNLYKLSNNGLTIAGDTNTAGTSVGLGNKVSVVGNGNTATTGYSSTNVMTDETADGSGAKVPNTDE